VLLLTLKQTIHSVVMTGLVRSSTNCVTPHTGVCGTHTTNTLATLVVNKLRGGLKVAAVKAPASRCYLSRPTGTGSALCNGGIDCFVNSTKNLSVVKADPVGSSISCGDLARRDRAQLEGRGAHPQDGLRAEALGCDCTIETG